MAERRENSVLFSLKELRQIEDERVRDEENAEKARIDGERRAKEDAELKAKQEEERKRREEEDRVQRLQSEKERQVREEQLRLEADKHRAQVEAAARLEEARMHAEVQAKASEKKAPMGLVLGSIGGVVALAAGALCYVFFVVIPQRDLAAKQEQDRVIASIRAQAQNQLEAIGKQQNELKDQLAKASTDAEKARIQAAIASNAAAAEKTRQAAQDSARKVISTSKKPQEKKPGEKKLNCDPATDPLCGSGL